MHKSVAKMTKNKTQVQKVKDEITVDAAGRTLGRVASEVAVYLMGKNKPSFEKHKYSGSPVRVLNTSKIKITNKKLEEIFHTRYSGYPGGLKVMKGSYTVEKKGFPELVRLSVYHMLPDNKLRREMMKNLFIEA